MDHLLAEDLFALFHDPHTGRAKYNAARGYGYAGALLLDLARSGFVRVEHDRLLSESGAPDEPLLYRALAVIAAEPKPRGVPHWIRWIPSALAPLEVTIGRALVARGAVEEQRGKALGLFPITRWPARDPTSAVALRERLGAALVEGTEPSAHDALLISLLGPLDLMNDLVVWDQRKLAKSSAKAITAATKTGSEMSASVLNAIDAIDAALRTVMSATTVGSG